MGAPLISAIYETDPNVGLYTLPLLIWHPMQLLVGSILAPKLGVWSAAEKKRLAELYPADDDDDEDDDDYFKELENQSGKTQQSGSTQKSGNTALSTDSAAYSRPRVNSRDEDFRSADARDVDNGSSGGGSLHHSDDNSYAYSMGMESMTYADNQSMDDMTYGSYERTRKRLPKCTSDHRFYEVGIVYQMVTEPEELLNINL